MNGGCEFCDRSATHSIWGHPVCDWSDCEDRATEAGPPAGFTLDFAAAPAAPGTEGAATDA